MVDTKDNSDQPTYQSLGHQLWIVGLGWQRVMKRALKPLGLTPTQFLALDACARLHKHGTTGPSQKQIATRIALDTVTTQRAIVALERVTLLTRHPSYDRHLSWQVELEPAGYSLLSDARQAANAATRLYLEKVHSDQLRGALASFVAER